MKFIFSIEGNIGSGKSSYVKFLKENYKISGLQVIYLPEPVKSGKKSKMKQPEKILLRNFTKTKRNIHLPFK